MSSSITDLCATLNNQREKLSIEELNSFFDLIVNQLKQSIEPSEANYEKLVNTLKSFSSRTLTEPSVINHEIFPMIENCLINQLNQWPKANINESLFEEIIELFRKLIQHIKSTNQVLSSPFRIWFLNELFFQAIASVLEDISSRYLYYFNQDQHMKSLSMLIQLIRYFQSGIDEIRNHPSLLLLINPIIQCLSSSLYFETLKNLNIKSNSLNSFQEFLLKTLPCFVIWNRGKAQLIIIKQLCLNHLLESSQEIYQLFLSSINDWEYQMMDSIFYMTAFLRYVAYYPSTREYLKDNLQIIDSILILLNSSCLIDNILTQNDYNAETNVTDSAISFIFNLIDDLEYLSIIKENRYFSKDVFLRLKHAKVDRVRLHAFMILAKVLNEDDIQKLDHIDALVSVFFDYLTRAVDDPCQSFQDVPIKHLLTSLKAFVQHDEIKEEIYRQNFVEFLLRCVRENLVLQISLEIIWNLIFNQQIQQILINKYKDFLVYLRTDLINSDVSGVAAAAKGILWKIENESIHSHFDEKYDLMISYSHSNKDLCHQLYHQLCQLNYRVWLDFQNMYGSTLESMAEAIESSDIILICMSSEYKQSAYCRSEAEYAYTRQRQIIPLVMERKYRPDGWLGFICASKMYVDFTKTTFEQAFPKLITQIQFHQRKSSIQNEPLIHDNTSTLQKETKTLERITSIQSNYHEQYLQWWTHEDVLSFLRERNFDLIHLLIENEPLFDGHSLYLLYQQSQLNIDSTYQLLNSQLTQSHDRNLSYLTFIQLISEVQKQLKPIGFQKIFRFFLWKIYQKFF